MNKKILHLIPTLEGGGAERQLTMLALEQAKRGWDVHIGIRRGGVHANSLNTSHVFVHQLGDCKGVSPRLLLRINSLLQEIKPDLVQTWLPQMDIVGGIAALWNTVPWVVSERTSRLSYKGICMNSWVRKPLVRYATAVVANSSNGVAYWRGVLPIDACVFQVANAVDMVAIRNAAYSESASFSRYKQNILVVGRLVPEKAVDIVIKAISLLPSTLDVGFLIMGEGPLREEIEAGIKDAGVDGRVFLSSYRQDWWGLLKSASALVSMSRVEGQPNVVLEAMAAGCPLIVSDIPEHREILSDDSASFVPVNDSVELAASIKNLLSDPDAARKRAEQARSYADGLTIQLAADAYESVYTKVCCEKGAA
jgi:glycosyltransferase involved in cell wall biosynthesis